MGRITKKQWKDVNKREAFIAFMDGKRIQYMNFTWQSRGWHDIEQEPNWELDHIIYRVHPKDFDDRK